MSGRSFPEISCIICSKPLDLSRDLSADEYGKAVHTECYVNRLIAAHSYEGAGARLSAFCPSSRLPVCMNCGDSSESDGRMWSERPTFGRSAVEA